jgi:membrane protein DedA with SNARE-associated domain
VFSLARAAVALLGYVVVAVIAYWIGKFVGRSERRERRDET